MSRSRILPTNHLLDIPTYLKPKLVPAAGAAVAKLREADGARYEARHSIGTEAWLALDLSLYTGVRRSDVVRLGPQMERDGKLVFTETKGSSRIVKTHEWPILPPLYRSIDAAPSSARNAALRPALPSIS
ncbi:MAG TPA: hypothetical protein VHT52_12150 [Stellaceae bacterium]|nr:hypothetical protein [Stellaceae bacterium]